MHTHTLCMTSSLTSATMASLVSGPGDEEGSAQVVCDCTCVGDLLRIGPGDEEGSAQVVCDCGNGTCVGDL